MNIDNKYIVLSLPFICFILGYLASIIVIGNTNYTTPNLTGLSVYEATKITSPHQINIRIISEKESPHIPPGTIINQKPSAGRIIKTHQPILVTTTKAPPVIKAPNLLEQKKEIIDKTCHDLNIKTKAYYLEFLAPRNTCIAQLPQSFETITDNKIIVYLAQDKPNMYLMPDFTQQQLKPSLELLERYADNIAVFKGSQRLAPPYPEDANIINQKPLAGSLISVQPAPSIQLEIK